MVIDAVAPETLEKVSRQFAKLMEKAKSTDSEGEAANCVALAQKLLWESSLEEDQLLSLKDLEKRARNIIKDGVDLGPSKYALNYAFNSREWKSELLEVLAKNFFCRTHQGYETTVALIGEPKSIEIVKGLYVYLEKQIRASRKVAFNLAKANGEIEFAHKRRYWDDKPRALSQHAVHSFKDSFAKGAVAALGARLAEQQKENIEAANESHAQMQDVPAIGYGAALVAQIYSDLDEAFYEFFPDLHPAQVKLRAYQRQIEYNERMAELEKQRQIREEKIANGELPPEEPAPPVKEYKRRGRKPRYRSTFNPGAYSQGHIAGASIQINPALSKKDRALNA
jgi:hypothetical protein